MLFIYLIPYFKERVWLKISYEIQPNAKIAKKTTQNTFFGEKS